MKIRPLIAIFWLRLKVMLNYLRYNNQSRFSTLSSPIVTILFSVIFILCIGFAFHIFYSKFNNPVELQLAASVIFLFIVILLTIYHIISGQFMHRFSRNSGDTEFLLCQPLTFKEFVIAKIIEYTGSDFVSIFIMVSFFGAFAFKTNIAMSGFILVIFSTLLAVLFLNVVLFIFDQVLRRFFSPEKLKNVLTIVMFVAGLLFFAILGKMNTFLNIHTFVSQAGELRTWLAYSPIGLLINTYIALTNKNYDILFYDLCGVILYLSLFLYLTFHFIALLGKSGWTMVESPYATTNCYAAPNLVHINRLVKGFIKKDFLMYRRDPKILFGAIGLPILAILFVLIINKGLFKEFIKNPVSIAVFIFGCLAYVSAFCCVRTLDPERKSIWIWYLLPQTTEAILWSKVKMWSVLLAGTGIVLFVIAGVWHRWPFWSLAGNGILFTVGIFLVTVMGIGISAAGSNLESDKYTTVTPIMTLIFCFFAYSFILVFLVKELWPKVMGIFLFSCLALACWQAGVRRMRYILDSEKKKPDRISIGEGLATVAIFFLIQNIFFILTRYFVPQIGVTITISYAFSGILTSIISISYVKQRSGDTIQILGSIDKGLFYNCMKGLAWGYISSLCAILYLLALKHLDLYRFVQDQTLFQPTVDNRLFQLSYALVFLLIVPIAEEIIFRGVLFKSLNNVWTSKFFAVVIGALLFAMIHPLASVIPVFILGVITCELYKNTKSLAPSIMAHAIHNAFVIATTWYIG